MTTERVEVAAPGGLFGAERGGRPSAARGVGQAEGRSGAA